MLEKYAIEGKAEELKQLELPLVILGLGKLGGQEPNYHSDLDIVFVYNSEPELIDQFESRLLDGISCQFLSLIHI